MPEAVTGQVGDEASMGPGPAKQAPSHRLRRRQIVSTEWKVVKGRIEMPLRPAVLRYGRLDYTQLKAIVLEALQDDQVDEDDNYFCKGMNKARTNMSTWKNRTLSCMEVSRSSRVR